MFPADSCLAAAEFLDKEYKEENVEVVAWMTVKGKYEDDVQHLPRESGADTESG